MPEYEDWCGDYLKEESFTTEFHGEKDDFRTKTPWYSVSSVVKFLLFDSPYVPYNPLFYGFFVQLVNFSFNYPANVFPSRSPVRIHRRYRVNFLKK